jgi:hypothetical protein
LGDSRRRSMFATTRTWLSSHEPMRWPSRGWTLGWSARMRTRKQAPMSHSSKRHRRTSISNGSPARLKCRFSPTWSKAVAPVAAGRQPGTYWLRVRYPSERAYPGFRESWTMFSHRCARVVSPSSGGVACLTMTRCGACSTAPPGTHWNSASRLELASAEADVTIAMRERRALAVGW